MLWTRSRSSSAPPIIKNKLVINFNGGKYEKFRRYNVIFRVYESVWV